VTIVYYYTNTLIRQYAMLLAITPAASTPIYLQIVEQVRRMVAGGQLKPGDELPSVRAVASHHSINPMTVSKAYSQLESEGLLERRRGVGMSVAKSQPRARIGERRELLRPSLKTAAQAARQLEISDVDAHALLQACLDEISLDKDGTNGG
jgi:GntR family transcriptional regulator